jgi:peptidoglycan/LPS O-acetylase OafA/YrhL
VVLSPKGPYIDGVVWSLVVEAAFYIFIAGTICVAARWGGLARCLTISAFAIGAASTAFTIVDWLAVKTAVFEGSAHLAASLDWFGFSVLLLHHGVFFAVGMLLYQAIERGFSNRIAIGLAAFGLACCLRILISVKGGHSSVAPILIWSAATCAAYASARYAAEANSQYLRRFLRPIGLMTYPLYLNHFVLGQALMPLFASWLSGFGLFLTLFVILLANAAFIAMFPERWLQRGLRDLLFRKALPLAESRVGAATH